MAPETNPCLRELEVEVPAETVEREMERATREFARTARIPGFRPGKAPAALVRSRFSEEIRSEVLQALIPDSFETAAREKNLRPVAGPRFGQLEFEPGKPLRFRATFEVLPEIRLGDYKGLEIEPVKIEVTDEDVARELEGLRESAATLEPVEERGVEDGDTAVLRLVGSVTRPAARKPILLEEALCQVGAETTLEPFTQGLLGARPREERTIEVNYPDDYPGKELAGTSVTYRATVKAIKRKQLPPLDDEFAQQVGPFKTLAELRDKLRANLEAARDQRERELVQERLLDALLARHDFPVPDALVEEQVETRLERRVRALVSQGIDPRRLDVDWLRLRRQQHQPAERDVRVGLLIERIAESEALEATEAELEREIARLAEGAGETPAALRARLTSEGGLDRIRRAIRSEKAVEFLRAHARVRGR